MTVADLAPGRVELGIGIGGHPAEHCRLRHRLPGRPRSGRRGWRRRSRSSGRCSRVARPTSRAGTTSWPRPMPRRSPSPAPRIMRRRGDAMRGAPGGPQRRCLDHLRARTSTGCCRSTSRRSRPPVGDRSDVRIIVRHGRAPRRRRPPRRRSWPTWPATTAAWRERGADELVLHWIHAGPAGAVSWLPESAPGRRLMVVSSPEPTPTSPVPRPDVRRPSSRGFLSPAPGGHPVSHCVRCGKETPPGVSMCEADNPGRHQGAQRQPAARDHPGGRGRWASSASSC